MIEAKIIPVGMIKENISIGRGPKGDKGDIGDVTPEAKAAKEAAQNAAEAANTAAETANTAAEEAKAAVRWIETAANEILLRAYPVGSIYMSASSANPGNLFGGTWESWGSGRVPVGVDTSDTDFAPNKSGGAKTINLKHSHTVDSHSHTIAHTHTVNSHSHTIAHTHTVNSHYHSTENHSLTVSEMPYHNHSLTNSTIGWPQNAQSTAKETYTGWGSSTWPLMPKVTQTNYSGSGSGHNHGNTGNASPGTGGASTSNSGNSSPATGGTSTANSGASTPGTNTGLSENQSILQPYITCYMWKRIA